MCRLEEKQYYVLRPLNTTGKILIPTDTCVFMRPIMTQQEAERLIDQIPTMKADPYFSSVLTELNQHYSEAIHSHNCQLQEIERDASKRRDEKPSERNCIEHHRQKWTPESRAIKIYANRAIRKTREFGCIWKSS